MKGEWEFDECSWFDLMNGKTHHPIDSINSLEKPLEFFTLMTA